MHSIPTIKRIVALLILAITLTTAAIAGDRSSLGLRVGYVSRHENASVGLYYRYRFTSHFALAPSVDYIFRHHDADGLLLNVDAHVPFALSKFEIYPLAGLNFSTWSDHTLMSGASDDVTTRTSRFGFNVGAGVAINITPTLRLGLEGKFTGVKSMSSGAVTMSIGYNF